VRKTDAFWDASALVPLCASQSASAFVRAALKSRSIVAWWAAPVEITGALCRFLRDGQINQRQFQRSRQRLESLRASWVEIPPVERVRELADVLLQRHPLRAADAFQLAAALVWCDERPAKRPFLCFDRRLAEAAVREGFEVEAFGVTPRRPPAALPGGISPRARC